MTNAIWNILVYFAAHNDLYDASKVSLEQLKEIGGTPSIRLNILIDLRRGAQRYAYDDSKRVWITEQLTTFNSGDPDSLIQIANWAFTHPDYKADRYGLILWSHGTGWEPEELRSIARAVRGDDAVSVIEAKERSLQPVQPALFRSTLSEILKLDAPLDRAICFDDGSQQSLDTVELGRVVAEISKQSLGGKQLDLLGMDACLMASLEVAEEVRPYVLSMIAAEEPVPSSSWPYKNILTKLSDALVNNNVSGPAFANMIVDEYMRFYEDHPPKAGSALQIALDLTKLGSVTSAMNNLAETLLADLNGQKQPLWDAQRLCEKTELGPESSRRSRDESKFRFYLWDIASLARELIKRSQNESVQNAARALLTTTTAGQNQSVLANRHLTQDTWYSDIGGLTVYLPPPNIAPRVTPYYQHLAFAKNTAWYKLIQKYSGKP